MKHSLIALTIATTLMGVAAHAGSIAPKLVAKPAAVVIPKSATAKGTAPAAIGSFTQTFELRTSSNYDNKLGTVSVSSFGNHFSALSFSIITNPSNTFSYVATPTGAGPLSSWSGQFTDSTEPLINLTTNTPYTIVVKGTSTTSLANLTLNATGGFESPVTVGTSVHVAAVPEPESYALLLAGLGLIGTIAHRRKANAAA